MKEICAVTGTRAEYGLFRPVFKAIQDKSELDLSLIVTGMHLSEEFGMTISEIEKDGFPIKARIDVLSCSDTLLAMVESVGNGIVRMAQAYDTIKPDMVLVLGDRSETFAAAVSAAYLNIPVGHIHGGDTTMGGTIDDANRHAITKFAHIHFPATSVSAQRIINLGEEEWRVHLTGSPALDSILNDPDLSDKKLSDRLGLDFTQPFVLLVQHPVTTQVDQAPSQMRTTLEALVELNLPIVIIYPNADAGGRQMIDVIREYQYFPQVHSFKSLSHQEYLGLMRRCTVMVGNSSSGLIEAPSFGTPVINVGIRQFGRERGANVIDVDYDKADILRGVEKAMNDKAFLRIVKKCVNPYGDGTAGKKIARILAELEITPALLQKRVTY